jgi:hypothetical protein
MKKTFKTFKENFNTHWNSDRLYHIYKEKKIINEKGYKWIFYIGIGLWAAGVGVFALSFAVPLAFTGFFQNVAFVLVKTGFWYFRDYMLGNVDDIDSYIKKSLGLMGVEIAILAVSSSAVRDLVSSKVKDGIKK